MESSEERKSDKEVKERTNDIYNVTVRKYNYASWGEYFPNNNVDLMSLLYLPSWQSVFQNEQLRTHIMKAQKKLSSILRKVDGKIKIFPPPELVFNAFNMLSLKRVKVVIIGQDPYFNQQEIRGKNIPEAMGLSFSVPTGMPIPSSLKNIFKNMVENGRLLKMPEYGNLHTWACQGCLMLNSSLTVQHKNPNGHAPYWEDFTDSLIKWLSDNNEKLVFVLWGKPASKKLDLIDDKKHEVIISSHPSGQSCHKTMEGTVTVRRKDPGTGEVIIEKKTKTYLPFIKVDHFGMINNYLEKNGKKPIIW